MSVILDVEHTTTYRYANPVMFGPHRVAFHPRAAHDIRVLQASLAVSPHSKQHWIHDVFSNSVAVVEPLVPANELRLTARFQVEHHGVKNQELPIDPEAEQYPFQYSPQDQTDLAGFLISQYPNDVPVLRDWIARFLPQQGRIHTRDVLTNITEAIRGDFRYASRDAMGTQGPARTLQLQTGTCRDFALLMIEAARSLGLAARFVSGYIYDPALDLAEEPQGVTPVQSMDVGGTLGSGATHAWLHVFLPGAGWVPFDPTNTLYGGTDLSRVAYTRTPEQAAPVSGSWGGQAQDFLGMEVVVNVRRVCPPVLDRPDLS
jgi:transglutaminase-like putative cysteine protease